MAVTHENVRTALTVGYRDADPETAQVATTYELSAMLRAINDFELWRPNCPDDAPVDSALREDVLALTDRYPV